MAHNVRSHLLRILVALQTLTRENGYQNYMNSYNRPSEGQYVGRGLDVYSSIEEISA